MCGILGLAGLSPAEFDARLGRLAWRGPDQRGRIPIAGLRLGCQRLAISDASATQPIAIGEPGRRCGIVFNGNLADPAAWRRRLAAHGETPVSHNDAEIPLRVWRALGTPGLRELEGQFAFAIVDESQQTLVLARDAFGEKPLLLRERPGEWPDFASAAPALTTGATRVHSLAALGRFLLRGWLAPADLPDGLTLLPPNTLRLLRRGDPPEEHRFAPLTERGSAEVLLRRAVARRLDGDREIALFLSGGIDSAAIALALHELGVRVRCYSADFAGGRHEGERAALVARALGLPLRRVTIGPEILDALPGLLAWHGLPFGDASVLALFALARAAREDGVGIALLGDGGDELFGGYRRMRAWDWARAAQPLAWVLAPLARGAHGELGRFARALVRDDYAALWEQARVQDVARLLGTAARPPAPLPHGVSARDAELGAYLPSDLCTKSDLATLAAGIEARAPLLDASLAALGSGAPNRGERTSKQPLRAWLARRLPAALREGPKHGFGLPLADWLAHTSFLDHAWERLAPHGPLHRGLLQRWTYELRQGDRRRATLLWHAAALACAP